MRSFRTSLFALLSGLSLAGAAYAQPAPRGDELTPAEKNNALRNQEVTEREQPDYAPKGTDLGGFTLFPLVELTERFTDNLYYGQNERREDMVTSVQPSLRLKSKWSVHEVELHGGSEIKRHLRHDSEDVENYNAGAKARLDVTSDLLLRAALNWEQGHEARSSPDDAGGVTPTETSTTNGLLGGEYRGGRIRLKGVAEETVYSFKDVRKSDGTTVRSSARDRTVDQLTGRVGYEIIPEYTAFVEGVYNDRRYDQLDINGVDRDSHGYEGRLGTEIEISGALRGEVFAGYVTQFYDNSDFETVRGPGGGLALTWTPTGLTTIKTAVTRTINETTTRYSAGSMGTSLSLSVAHELLRNVILEADGSLSRTSFMNTGRNDMLWNSGVRGTYKLNRYAYSSLDYHVARLNNNIDTGKYTENAVFLKLGLQY